MSVDADWFLHHDVDETRRSPWPGVTLRDAIYRVDQEGFNCIDHTVLEFCPTDNGYPRGSNFEAYFEHFSPEVSPGTYPRVNTWRKASQSVSLAWSGGHDARFDGRRVFPRRFLLKHYPIRSQAHGERKVFRERRPRWDPTEKGDGWHIHYDRILEGHCFLRRPSELVRFEDEVFQKLSLVERMSTVAVQENDHLTELLRQSEEEQDRLRTLHRQGEEERDRLVALLRQTEEQRDQSQLYVNQTERERDELGALLSERDEERDRLRALLHHIEGERDNLLAQAFRGEKERDRLKALVRQTEDERDALLAHLDAVAKGKIMRLMNKVGSVMGRHNGLEK
ncbi:MAG: hypothetical protein HY675_20370 [Chloroflexi bacterium]|nr:hypothetical protein [Chloroflexota bacterium]